MVRKERGNYDYFESQVTYAALCSHLAPFSLLRTCAAVVKLKNENVIHYYRIRQGQY